MLCVFGALLRFFGTRVCFLYMFCYVLLFCGNAFSLIALCRFVCSSLIINERKKDVLLRSVYFACAC